MGQTMEGTQEEVRVAVGQDIVFRRSTETMRWYRCNAPRKISAIEEACTVEWLARSSWVLM